MKKKTGHSRPVLQWIVIFIIGMVLIIGLSLYFGWAVVCRELAAVITTGLDGSAVDKVNENLQLLKFKTLVYGVSACLLVLLVWGLCLWGVLVRKISRFVLRPGSQAAETTDKKRVKTEKKESAETVREKIVYKTDVQKERRLFAHLLSKFQQDGRFVDFLFENLDQYEDDQIGAAVRNIHENCRRVMTQYLHVKPVSDSEEGEAVTVDRGFNMDSITLVGNVTGEPPFRGTVRHAGWQITQWHLPDFSDESDAGILHPAEIEII